MNICDEPWLVTRPALRKKCLEGGRYYTLIASGWRPGAQRLPPAPKPREPSAPCGCAKMAWNLTKALTAFVADGLRTVDTEEYRRRLSICDGCEQLNTKTGRCRVCGCFVAAKAVGRVWQCPIGQWDADTL